jgi:hypothetical protein
MAGERVLTPIPRQTATLPAGTIATPFQFGTTGEDSLRVRVWYINFAIPGAAGVIPQCVGVALRELTAERTIQLTNTSFTPTNDRLATTGIITLTAGFIQSLTVTWNGPSVFTGLCYVTVDLIRGSNLAAAANAGQLIGGYIRPGGGQAWPGSPIVSSVAGRGYQRDVAFTSFPIGADVTLPQPLLTRWCVRSIVAVLLTSAIAANRYMAIAVVNPVGSLRADLPAPVFVGASTQAIVTWLWGASQAPASGAPVMLAPFPSDFITEGNTQYSTSTVGLDISDQYQTFRIFVEEWLEANV